jgi:phage gp36-like protein
VTAYATQADLVERFGSRELAQLTDETAAAAPDPAEISKALDEASSLIDGYLGSRYTLPLSSVPTMVRKWACDIARCALWKDRAMPDSVVVANRDLALSQLKDAARGAIVLSGVDGVATASSGGYARSTPVAYFDTTGLL